VSVKEEWTLGALRHYFDKQLEELRFAIEDHRHKLESISWYVNQLHERIEALESKVARILLESRR